MIFSPFQDHKLSLLGFGAMRLPLLADGSLDEPQITAMVDYAIASGINYFDTAYPYHGGLSELVMGRALNRHPRDSFRLATKYPGHQLSSSYDPAAIFEEQLRKCGVGYFDFYLLHNVCELSLATYLDPRWGILEYFREQKRQGRIHHLGFSSHGAVDNLTAFLDVADADMEFCQIQLNWLDWTLQDAAAKVDLLNERGVPIWVMEPLRGGRLCRLDEQDEALLCSLRPDEGIPAWSFRFLESIPGVTVILSGMSTLEQLQENVATLASMKPLNAVERSTLFEIAARMQNQVPCTGCRYCVEHCPLELDIPLLLNTCSELRFSPGVNVAMRLEALPPGKQPSACLSCAACSPNCPQGIDIPAVIAELNGHLAGIPKWADICREREEAARRLRS